MRVRNFCVAQNRNLALSKAENRQRYILKSHRKRASLPNKLYHLKQHLNHLKNTLAREKNKMKQQHQSDRKVRTRSLIQAAGLLQKSGILEAFSIAPGDDLQDYDNREKAAQLLGFLTMCFQKNDFDESNLERWRSVGERLMRN